MDPKWDILLAKYVRVWIWTLLFGTTAGLSYSYLGVDLDRPWGSLAVLPLALLVVGIFSALGAWWSLYVYLKLSIIPVFFDLQSLGVDASAEDDELKGWRALDNRRLEPLRQLRTRQQIVKCYQFLLLAGISRLLISLSELIYAALRSGGIW